MIFHFWLASDASARTTSNLIRLRRRFCRRSSPPASPHLCSRVRLRKSASCRRVIFPDRPHARKQVQDYRRLLFSSHPSTRLPSTPLPIALLQDRASRARYNNNRASSWLLSERADFAGPAVTPAQPLEKVRHSRGARPARIEAEDRSDFGRPVRVRRQ